MLTIIIVYALMLLLLASVSFAMSYDFARRKRNAERLNYDRLEKEYRDALADWRRCIDAQKNS